MENLLRELQIIEEQHKDFFEVTHLKLISYISISKTPVMIRFNKEMNNKFRLPDEIYDKVNNLVMSYYFSKTVDNIPTYG